MGRKTASQRVADINWRITTLRIDLTGGWGIPGEADPVKRADIERQIEHEQGRLSLARKELEVVMSRDKAKTLREAFRKSYRELAGQYHEAQSDQYPQQYRDTEGARIKQEMRRLEAQFQNDLILWQHGQRVEAARLRASDPLDDPAVETRRLREQLEAASLAEQFPSTTQAKKRLLPEGWRLLNAGNIERAQVYFDAAKRVGVHDGTAEHEINRLLDATVPHRRQAVQLEIAVAHEAELARKDVAEAKVESAIGTQQETGPRIDDGEADGFQAPARRRGSSGRPGSIPATQKPDPGGRHPRLTGPDHVAAGQGAREVLLLGSLVTIRGLPRSARRVWAGSVRAPGWSLDLARILRPQARQDRLNRPAGDHVRLWVSLDQVPVGQFG